MFRRTPNKVNPKDFTPEQIESIWRRQDLKCHRCHKKSCFYDGPHLVFGDTHHRKPRSAMSVKEHQENWMWNGVGLCRLCHGDVHNRVKGTEEYRIAAWQEVPHAVCNDKEL